MNSKKMNLFALRITALGTLMLLMLSSCQTKDSLSQTISDTPQVESRAGMDCTDGAMNYFGLEQIDPLQITTGASYAFRLEDIAEGYTLGTCVCSVDRYELTFSYLPNGFRVEDQFDGYIPHTTSQDPNSDEETIVIDVEHAMSPMMEIHVFFDDVPLLVNAGGLCIVDNLGGTDNPFDLDIETTHFAPVVITYQPTSSFWVSKMIMPTFVTTPVQ